MGTSDLPRWTEVGKLGTDCSRSASELGGSLVGLSPPAVGSALTLVAVRIELNPRTHSRLLEVWGRNPHISCQKCCECGRRGRVSEKQECIFRSYMQIPVKMTAIAKCPPHLHI